MDNVNRYHIPTVEEFMTRKVITFTSEMDIGHVLKTLNKYRISSAPVIASEESRQVVGLISEDDIMREMANSSFFYGPSEPLKVEEAMVGHLIKLTSAMDLFEVIKIFQEENLRHAPVLDEQNHLLGIVARRDVLRELEKILAAQENHIRDLKTSKSRSMINEASWKLGFRE